ncbi:hypothetical protein ABK040_002011 [Willaertia magna]
MSSSRKGSAKTTSSGKSTAKQFQKPSHCLNFDSDQMITIITSDGFSYQIDKRCAVYAKKWKSEIEEQGRTEIHVEYDSQVIEQVIQYLYYKQRYDPEPEVRPEFGIDLSSALNLMVAAYNLQC